MSPLISAFIKGLIFGVTTTAIPGPVFFLILQRTLAYGLLMGLVCALGALAADGLYALIAFLGLSFITDFLMAYQSWFMALGGIFLCYLGFSTYRKKSSTSAELHQKASLWSAGFSTFVLTATNPVSIVIYCILFTSLVVSPQENNQPIMLSMLSGVIFGALVFSAGCVGLLSYYRQQLSEKTIDRLNKIAGIILTCFGIAALWQTINKQ